MTGGYVGVDLDGTLAYYDEWRGPTHIGPPVPRMLARVKRWLSEGQDVRIITARVSPKNPDSVEARHAILDWCLEHVGQVLPVSSEKCFAMVALWDDRAVQVVKNTGERADGVRD